MRDEALLLSLNPHPWQERTKCLLCAKRKNASMSNLNASVSMKTEQFEGDSFCGRMKVAIVRWHLLIEALLSLKKPPARSKTERKGVHKKRIAVQLVLEGRLEPIGEGLGRRYVQSERIIESS
jgi:hypothetical protein